MTSLRPLHTAGYTVILPPGWLRLDARSEHGTEELDRELDRVLSTVSRDSFGPLIAEARKMAHTVLERARVAGALDLYLLLGGMHRWVLASFTTVGVGKPDDDIAELLVGLFDAIMLTWRWRPGLVI